jgi:GxxExxY protein
MRPFYSNAHELSRLAIAAAIEVHRLKGLGLIESIYERCLMRELELRHIPAVNQRLVRVEYKAWSSRNRSALTTGQ